MTDQITVSRELLRKLQSLCMEVRQQSSPRMVALAIPLWDALRAALEHPAQQACPTCGSDCNERDELIKAEREIERLNEELRFLREHPVQEPVAKVIWPSASGLPSIEWMVKSSEISAEMLLFAAPQPAQQQSHEHQWFRTGAMEPGKMRCILCGQWHQEPNNRTLSVRDLSDHKQANGSDDPVDDILKHLGLKA